MWTDFSGVQLAVLNNTTLKAILPIILPPPVYFGSLCFITFSTFIIFRYFHFADLADV